MKKFITILSIITIVSLLAIPEVRANLSFFLRSGTGNTATCGGLTSTSTYSYIAAGVGTTTITLDTGCGVQNGADSGIVLMQLFSSSTVSSTLKGRVEYSMDGKEWYPSNIALGSAATTTIITGSYNEFQWNATSTSIGPGDPGGSATTTCTTGTSCRIYGSFPISVPTEWVRVKFYVPPGSNGGGLYAEIVGKKQFQAK